VLKYAAIETRLKYSDAEDAREVFIEVEKDAV
jgi:hypothetical protein